MSNSALATYTNLSPYRNSPRSHAIDTITIHCTAYQGTAQRIVDGFKSRPAGKEASANYAVGYDGSIGLAVEEKDRSWCTGGPLAVNGITGGMNDERAVTIEVASDNITPYAVTDKAYAALIDLVADICRRNDIKKLRWIGDKAFVGQVDKQNMTVHRWFANKACPGNYLYDRHGEIAAAVNKRLEGMDLTEKDRTEVQKMIDEEITRVFPVYGVFDDIPEGYQPAITKLLAVGALKGRDDRGTPNTDDDILNVSEDFCRVMTVLDRLNLLG